MNRHSIFPILMITVILLAGCDNKKADAGNETVKSEEGTSTDQDKQLKQADNPAPPMLRNEANRMPELSTDQVLEAALNGNLNIVSRAVENGFEIDATDPDGHTALMLAAYNGHSDIIQFLLKRGAVADARDHNDRTALMYASTGPFNTSVKLLLEAGADPNLVDNEEQFTPLMFAAAEGQTEVVKTLLKNGADKTRVDVDGESAYDFAVNNGHTEVAKLVKPD